MSIAFTVTSNGLSASVDALAAIVAAVNAYFEDPNRALTAPIPPVLAGEWETFKNENAGAPGYVVIDEGPFQYFAAGKFPPAAKWAPNQDLPLDANHVAPVVGIRMQTFLVWTRGIAPGDFSTSEPGSAYALAQRKAAKALADLTFTALRDAHGHDLDPQPGKPVNNERAEFGYGHVLAWGFGPVPIPVLGDIKTLTTVEQVQASVQLELGGTPTTPGDGVSVS